MIYLAYRNLFQNKTRLAVSVGGVGLALLLILALDAIFTGVERQLTAYIDNSQADVFVAQSGVRNLHMASSSLPVQVIPQVEALPGVASVTPILYLSNMVVMGSERNLAYVIGVPPDAKVGTAWNVPLGKKIPGEGETIVDRILAEKSGIGIGGTVQILGRDFRVAGLSDGTTSLVNSLAFISLADFDALRGGPKTGAGLAANSPSPTISFLLVQVRPGVSSQQLAARIEAQVPGVTAQTRQDFASQERQVVQDMSTDVVTIMNLVGFMIGLAVLALSVYTATLARRKEFGVLKALGARNLNLYGSVLAQAILSVALGLGIGLVFTLLLSALLPRLGLSLFLEVSLPSLAKAGGVSLLIAGLSALLPVRQIAGLDPAAVFRGR
ncbi:MAG TPA: ABC transporter permease [Anaerolineales bacterium]